MRVIHENIIKNIHKKTLGLKEVKQKQQVFGVHAKKR